MLINITTKDHNQCCIYTKIYCQSFIHDHVNSSTRHIVWGLWCQKQVSQTGISNYVPQFTVRCNFLSLPEMPVSGAKVLIYLLLCVNLPVQGLNDSGQIVSMIWLLISWLLVESGYQQACFIAHLLHVGRVLCSPTVYFNLFIICNYVIYLSHVWMYISLLTMDCTYDKRLNNGKCTLHYSFVTIFPLYMINSHNTIDAILLILLH